MSQNNLPDEWLILFHSSDVESAAIINRDVLGWFRSEHFNNWRQLYSIDDNGYLGFVNGKCNWYSRYSRPEHATIITAQEFLKLLNGTPEPDVSDYSKFIDKINAK